MEAEIITIGDEILIGQITDTNSAWIGRELNQVGMRIARITSISDTKKAIVDALDAVQPDTKLVLITGGLGPTKDDITKKTLADYFSLPLVYDENIYNHILELFKSMGRVPSERNREQAMVPKGCRVLMNDVGTAPGMLFVKNGVYYLSMPGVPYEMKFIMKQHMLPIIEKELIRQPILHETIVVAGIPESELADQLHGFEESLPEAIKLAYLPRPGLVRLRLTAKGDDENEIRMLIDTKIDELKSTIGKAVLGSEDNRLEKIIGSQLQERGQTVATAESCTGGFIAHMITTVPGSSRYFLGSVIAYDNSIKQNLLGVSEETLEQHGAVSEAVVKQMAEGVREKLGTDWGIATSGIAGPDGGTAKKPVGTVWIAISGPRVSFTKQFAFGKNRERNIKRSALMALDLFRHKLQEN